MKPKQIKTEVAGMSPIIIALIILVAGATAYAIYAQCNSDQYILPYGFTGRVTVIYNQPQGASVERDDMKRLFYIPANGILTTQCDYRKSRAAQFYFLMPDSTLQPLSQGRAWGTSGMMAAPSIDTFFVGDVDVVYVDSLKANEAVFTVVKNL